MDEAEGDTPHATVVDVPVGVAVQMLSLLGSQTWNACEGREVLT